MNERKKTLENDENLSPVFSHDELMMVADFPDHFIPHMRDQLQQGFCERKAGL